ncbi:NfeD family protein [Bordetella tumulicola]|uniref:NfeD family protein n=1 Tax=Bordetella tumulicola TaxID=1649133 RepID=UPI0039F115C4
MTPTASLILVLVGIALMVAEVLTPALGLLGIAGLALLASGSLFLYDTQAGDFAVSVPLVTITVVIGALLLVLIALVVRRAQRRRVNFDHSTQPGESVEVLSWQGREGLVRAGAEIWQAHADIPLACGQPAVIVSRRGLILHVRAADLTQKELP